MELDSRSTLGEALHRGLARSGFHECAVPGTDPLDAFCLRRETYITVVSPQLSGSSIGFYINVDLRGIGDDEIPFRFMYVIGWGQSYSTRGIRAWEEPPRFDRYVLKFSDSWSPEQVQKAADDLVNDALIDLFDWEREMVKISRGSERMHEEFYALRCFDILETAHHRLLSGDDGGGQGASLIEDKLEGLRGIVDFVEELDLTDESRIAEELLTAICRFASEIYRSDTFLVPILQLNGGYEALQTLLSRIRIFPVIDKDDPASPMRFTVQS